MNNICYKYTVFISFCRYLFLFALLVFSFGGYSQTVIEVGGELTENTTWTSDYTYIVTDDLRVSEGLELTILPGVIVRFQANRGLFVEYGKLKVLGNYQNITDTVRFLSYEGQLWKGISLISVNGEGNNIIDHALIDQADIGIDVRTSAEVVVSNSTIKNCVTNDIRLSNSSNCIVTRNRLLTNGRVGLEIYSTGTGFTSSNNQVTYNSIIDSRYTNILVRFDYGGVCRNNQIKYNLIIGAEAGIFTDNSNLNSSDNIYIQSNVFFNNGGQSIGYGISSGMDNTVITNNLFWQDKIFAVQLRRGNNSVIANNSFYQSAKCIGVNVNAKNALISQNTFAENSNYVLTINEAGGFSAETNNFLNNELPEGIIRNHTFLNVDIAGQHWGTSDTTLIENMIWDYFDDGTLGELGFLPFLPQADTVAPVSPPFNPARQIVGGNTLISWHKNPEADLQGYAVYKGNFTNFGFDAEPTIVADTFLVLPGIQIEETIAITAFDLAGPGDIQRKTGHESPYAFAVNMPYAGRDTAICNNISPFRVLHSTVPFNYDQLVWQTDGDGMFDDVNALRPSYFPGLLDIEKGYATLSINAMKDNFVYKDSFKLILSKIPYVTAGPDLVTSVVQSIQLAEAEAGYFEQLVWRTLGDGFFDNADQINPVYSFGNQDLSDGNVTLIVSATSACGNISDTINISIRNQYIVEGRVLAQQLPVAGAAVLAVASFNGNGQEVREITNTNAAGVFRFSELYAGNYRFYAIPDTLSSAGLMPSYYVGKLKWQHAYVLPLVADTYQVEIELGVPGFQLPAGNASISGKFELPGTTNGFEMYCRPWFADNYPLYCDGGLSNVTVVLYNDKFNIPMDFTVTDHNGKFIFNNLPYGNYYIDAEIPGFETTVSELIEVNQEMRDWTNVTLRIENNNKIGIYLPDIISGLAPVYPNPAQEIIYINIDCAGYYPLKIEIYNMTGHKVYTEVIAEPLNSGESYISVDVSKLPAGHYIGKIVCRKTVRPFKFIVSH